MKTVSKFESRREKYLKETKRNEQKTLKIVSEVVMIGSVYSANTWHVG